MRTDGLSQLPMLLRALVALTFAFLSISHVASAQTPEQIEAFRNLPPEQQQAVLDAMRNGNGTGSTTSTRRDAPLATPSTVAPAAGTAPPSPIDMGPPRIAAGATLLLAATVPAQT